MAAANLDLLAAELAGNKAGREKYPGRVLDIQYEALVADPIKSVRQIYGRFNLPWTAEFEQAMTDYLARNPKGKHGRHRYSSADFGLTDEVIRARFAPYLVGI
jgi:hypothetical protein